ncbi:TonB-dependent hemoglobin/transferrin/lactoferrin family receptor [Martelella alba]|nr:TonB-dependent hemoglobin/transferrin/lactoferrin family receptor [Martelella alba]
MGTFRKAFLGATALATLMTAMPAWSQDSTATGTDADGDFTVLEPVTVTTTSANNGDASGVADTPLAVDVTAAELDRYEIQSVDDLGNMLIPGVAFAGDEGGSINIRGLQGPRVLTTIDGIPIPYLDPGARSGSGGGVDSFDFNAVANVDIVRGSDSSRAGSGAMGGAMVLSTLQPEDLLEPGKSWGGRLKMTYDSADRSLKTDAAIAAQGKQGTSILFQGIYTTGHETENQGTVGGTGATRSEANPANYDEDNFLFKLKQQVDDATTIGLTFERYDYDNDIDLMTAQGSTYKPGDWNGSEDSHRDRVSLDYSYDAFSTDGWIDAAWATLYWQRNQRISGTGGTRLTSPAGAYGRQSKITENDFGFNGWAENTIDAGNFQHNITVGGSFNYANTQQYSSGYDSCDVTYSYACNYYHNNQADTPEVDSYDLGLFAQDEIVFGDSGFALTPGVRLDAYWREPQDTAAYENNPMYETYGMPSAQNGVHVSPKLLATYDLTPDVQLYGQFSTAFRAPTTPELYMAYGSPGSYLSIGNPDLKPETSWGFELGSNFGDDLFGGRISAFYNRYHNFIDTETLSDSEISALGLDPSDYMFVYQNVNIENVQIAGLELSAQKQFENDFSVRSSLAFARGWNMETNEFLSSVAPLKAILGGGYNNETWGANANWVLQAAVSEHSDASYAWPGYGVVDLTAWWAPEQLNGFKIQAGVFNVFDQTYYDSLDWQETTLTQPKTYYSETGRSFRITLTQTF